MCNAPSYCSKVIISFANHLHPISVDNMLKTTISSEEINLLPHIKFTGKITLITTEEDSLQAIEKLKKERILGFDTESRPAFKKRESYPISLLQLSTDEEAFLFRLNKIPLGQEIISVLENESIIKTGVAIRDDIKGLKSLSHHQGQGFIEIADMARDLGIKKLGLRSLTAILLNKKLSKKNKLTNWEKDKLSADQLNYAATDAWLSLKVYRELKKFT